MDGLGVFKKLNDDDFGHVLEHLPDTDTDNFRCVSKGIESRVTFARQRIFKEFFIKGIDRNNCHIISEQLSTAMAKLHAPMNLKLWFIDEINAVMEQILVQFKDNITFLNFYVDGNCKVFLQPRLIFKSLESLDLIGNRSKYQDIEYIDTMVAVCEAMLAKHASKLKKLSVSHLNRNLNVASLPLLDSLALKFVHTEGACSMLDQCRHTITSVDIFHTDIDNTVDNTIYPNAVYEVPNLMALEINSSNTIKFALCNAENIVCLSLLGLDASDDVLEWPKFPKLKQLAIDDEDHLPILIRNRQTIECLILCQICKETFAIEMPRLTELILVNDCVYYFEEDDSDNEDADEFICKMLEHNYKSLEYLWISGLTLSYVDDDDAAIEKMRGIVLGNCNPKYDIQDRDRMAKLCPNASVVLLNKENIQDTVDEMKSRLKRKGYSLDIVRIFWLYLINLY